MKRMYSILVVVFMILGISVSSFGASNGVLLQKKVDIVYRIDGKMVRNVLLKYEPFNDKGIVFVSNLCFDGTPLVKTKILDVKVNDRKVHYRLVKRPYPAPYDNYVRYMILFDSLSPLDIVTVKYQQVFKFATDGYFWGKEKLSDGVEIKELYIRLRLPVGVDLKYNRPNGFSFSDEKKGNIRVVTIKAKNVSPSTEGTALFVYSSFYSWESLSKWIRSKIEGVLSKTISKTALLNMDPLGDKYRVINKVVEELKGIKIPIGKELPFVKTPLVVWKQRNGSLIDSSIFILSVLKQLGINCDYMFTGKEYFLKHYPPSPAILEKMLVRFTVGGKVMWYVPPHNIYYEDYPSAMEQGKEALMSVSIQNLPLSPPEENYNELVAHLNLFTDGSVSGDLDMSVAGYWDEIGYDWLKHYSYSGKVKKADRGYEYKAKYVAEFSGNKAILTVPAFNWNFLDRLKGQLPVSGSGKNLILPSTFMLKEVIEMSLPKGYKIGYMPKGIEMSYDVGYLKVVFDNMGRSVRVVVILKVYKRDIDADAAKHLALMFAVMRDRLRRSILLAK